MNTRILLLFLAVLSFTQSVDAQDISLYEQINGRYDFVFIGNTMNLQENGANDPCLINTTSAANLALGAGDTTYRAFLYWAGSGTGDFNVKLNDVDIEATRTFALTQSTSGMPFFSAFADVTAQVQTMGNGVYTMSELDVSPWLNPEEYCINGTNFAGWAIVIVYENLALPLNQVNVYDGLQGVPDAINITLNSLNVIDNDDAKIGFVAWEGDNGIAVNETLTINGLPIGNPPLNPVNNAFNGTNSFTNVSTLFNMDLDVYDIQNNIAIGDTTAEIALTSGQDFVMINAIVTKLNSQLPDATITVNDISRDCDSRTFDVSYTVYNINSSNDLPAPTPIAVYINDVLVGTAETQNIIPVGGSESGQITIIVPDDVPDDFEIEFVVDDDGLGFGHITELIETNNTYIAPTSLLTLPEFNSVPDLESCNLGFGAGIFDFSNFDQMVLVDATNVVSYYETLADAEAGTNPILNISNYAANATPKEIFIRVGNLNCFIVTSFNLVVRNCPPNVYNYISANNDGTNDFFFIDGLRNIFLNFDLEVYNRWGIKIWEGNNNTTDWDGVATKGWVIAGNNVPDGTYYYVLNLNDPDYQSPLTGYLYINR